MSTASSFSQCYQPSFQRVTVHGRNGGNTDHNMVGPNHPQLHTDSQEFFQACMLRNEERERT